MTVPCNERILKALSIARELIILADEGYACMEDDGCGVLFGVVRDCAHKIRVEAEREREAHKARGVWEKREVPQKE